MNRSFVRMGTEHDERMVKEQAQVTPMAKEASPSSSNGVPRASRRHSMSSMPVGGGGGYFSGGGPPPKTPEKSSPKSFFPRTLSSKMILGGSGSGGGEKRNSASSELQTPVKRAMARQESKRAMATASSRPSLVSPVTSEATASPGDNSHRGSRRTVRRQDSKRSVASKTYKEAPHQIAAADEVHPRKPPRSQSGDVPSVYNQAADGGEVSSPKKPSRSQSGGELASPRNKMRWFNHNSSEDSVQPGAKKDPRRSVGRSSSKRSVVSSAAEAAGDVVVAARASPSRKDSKRNIVKKDHNEGGGAAAAAVRQKTSKQTSKNTASAQVVVDEAATAAASSSGDEGAVSDGPTSPQRAKRSSPRTTGMDTSNSHRDGSEHSSSPRRMSRRAESKRTLGDPPEIGSPRRPSKRPETAAKRSNMRPDADGPNASNTRCNLASDDPSCMGHSPSTERRTVLTQKTYLHTPAQNVTWKRTHTPMTPPVERPTYDFRPPLSQGKKRGSDDSHQNSPGSQRRSPSDGSREYSSSHRRGSNESGTPRAQRRASNDYSYQSSTPRRRGSNDDSYVGYMRSNRSPSGNSPRTSPKASQAQTAVSRRHSIGYSPMPQSASSRRHSITFGYSSTEHQQAEIRPFVPPYPPTSPVRRRNSASGVTKSPWSESRTVYDTPDPMQASVLSPGSSPQIESKILHTPDTHEIPVLEDDENGEGEEEEEEEQVEDAIPEQTSRATPLYAFARNCEWARVSDECRRFPRDAICVGEKDGTTALHLAVMSRSNPLMRDGLLSGFPAAPLSLIEELVVACPEAAIIRCTAKRYTPLCYACMVADSGYDLEGAQEIVNIILKHAPQCIFVFTDEGYSALDIHILSYSRFHEELSEYYSAEASTLVLRTLLSKESSLADARAYGDKVRGPLELLYRSNVLDFKEATSGDNPPGSRNSVRGVEGAEELSEWWAWMWTLLILRYSSVQKNPHAPFSVVHACSRVVGVPLPMLKLAVENYPDEVKKRDAQGGLYNLPLHDVCSWVCDEEIVCGDPFVLRRKAQAIDCLLSVFPEAANMTNSMHETPLVLAVETCTPWGLGLEQLVDHCPAALQVPRRVRNSPDNMPIMAGRNYDEAVSVCSDDSWHDPNSAVDGMYPFLVAAVVSRVPEARRRPPAFSYKANGVEKHVERLRRKELESLNTIYELLRDSPGVLQLYLEENNGIEGDMTDDTTGNGGQELSEIDEVEEATETEGAYEH